MPKCIRIESKQLLNKAEIKNLIIGYTKLKNSLHEKVKNRKKPLKYILR